MSTADFSALALRIGLEEGELRAWVEEREAQAREDRVAELEARKKEEELECQQSERCLKCAPPIHRRRRRGTVSLPVVARNLPTNEEAPRQKRRYRRGFR